MTARKPTKSKAKATTVKNPTTRKQTKSKAKATPARKPAVRKAPKKATPRKRGGQTKYTPEIAGTILDKMASGMTLRQVCKAADMPSHPTVIRWANEDRDGFADRYAHARTLLCDHWADEIVEIADDGTNDWVERELKDGAKTILLDHEHVTRSRLRVDSRKWLLSKLQPKKYGDKLDLAVDATLEIRKIENVFHDAND